MIVPTKTRPRWGAAAFVLAGALAACADGAPRQAAAAEQPPLRVMVKLVRGSADGQAISAEASRIAGIPVSYAAATSPAWHALALHCTSTVECDAALARLRAASATYEAVEIDSRKTRSAS
jgi:hypothetical protein